MLIDQCVTGLFVPILRHIYPLKNTLLSTLVNMLTFLMI